MTPSSEEVYRKLLVLRCRVGDREAWEELIGRWEAPLFYYVRRLVPTEQDALDVLQDSWVKAIRHIRSLRDPERLNAWLYRIARTTALNHCRLEATYRAALEREMVDRPIEESIEDLQAEDAERIHLALAQLSMPHRDVLTLYFLQEQSIEEVANVLRIPAGTVKSRLHWARRALKGVLEQAESET